MRTCGFAFLIGLTIFCLSGTAFGALDPVIVLFFSFDEGSGNEAAGLSGNGNDGSINGAEWVNGKYGSALEFCVFHQLVTLDIKFIHSHKTRVLSPLCV